MSSSQKGHGLHLNKRKPYKFTDTKKDHILGHLRDGKRRGEAARLAGISRWTMTERMKADAEFRHAVDQAVIDANEQVEAALFKAAISGNTAAMFFWLQNRDPDRCKDMRGRREFAVGVGIGTRSTRFTRESPRKDLLRKLLQMRAQIEAGRDGKSASPELENSG